MVDKPTIQLVFDSWDYVIIPLRLTMIVPVDDARRVFDLFRAWYNAGTVSFDFGNILGDKTLEDSVVINFTPYPGFVMDELKQNDLLKYIRN